MTKLIDHPAADDLPDLEDAVLCEQLVFGANSEEVIVVMIADDGTAYYGAIDFAEFAKTAQSVLNIRN